MTEWIHAKRDETGGLILSPEAEAASNIVAEIFLMWRAVLKSKFPK